MLHEIMFKVIIDSQNNDIEPEAFTDKEQLIRAFIAYLKTEGVELEEIQFTDKNSFLLKDT